MQRREFLKHTGLGAATLGLLGFRPCRRWPPIKRLPA
ncbi:twin-arginine translocation signal domain-containing protein [Hymenobacter sp. 5516J-16]|nr:twin-arginine translocation signal domain-containing protein [Hymenobacter sp. 5516J-16]